MARVDWKRSVRGNPDIYTDQIFKALRGWQSTNGDWLAYFRWNPGATIMDPVYDEAVGQGLVFYPPFQLPGIHVNHIEGGNEYGEYGFYYNDDLDCKIPFDLFVQSGLTEADIMTGNYIKDRVYYDRKLFRVTQLSIEGQIQQRDTMVGMSATQLKPDELVNDVQFANWSLGGPQDTLGTE